MNGARVLVTEVEERSSLAVSRALRTAGYRVGAAATPFVVQRFERTGTLYSFAGVVRGGRLLGHVFARYLRVWPPQAGTVAAAVSEDAPDDLPGRVEALLAASGREGVFELELLRLPDGRLAAIDLNPRVYGSMSLALAAGVTLPALWAALRHLVRALGRRRVRDATTVARPPGGPAAHAFAELADPGPLLARLEGVVRGPVGGGGP